jgi:hypothetical protein
MKWRKSFGVLELKDSDFPREGYLSAGIIVYGKDLNGAQLMIMRAKVARKIKSWVPTAQRFLVYLIEKIDSVNTGKGNIFFLSIQNFYQFFLISLRLSTNNL